MKISHTSWHHDIFSSKSSWVFRTNSRQSIKSMYKMRLSEVVALWAVLIGFVSSNMNGPYKIANSHSFSTDYEKNSLEYFDVYSDIISTKYAEVHWRMHDAISLEDYLIERFRGKVMAIVGYEVDQKVANEFPSVCSFRQNNGVQ